MWGLLPSLSSSSPGKGFFAAAGACVGEVWDDRGEEGLSLGKGLAPIALIFGYPGLRETAVQDGVAAIQDIFLKAALSVSEERLLLPRTVRT